MGHVMREEREIRKNSSREYSREVAVWRIILGPTIRVRGTECEGRDWIQLA
jgi:hypothetical protein